MKTPDNSDRWLNVYSDINTAENHFGTKMRERVRPILETDPEPSETKARIVNVAYYLENARQPVDRKSLLSNWPAVRQQMAKQWFKHDKDVTDLDLYSFIGQDMRRTKNDDESMSAIAQKLQDAAYSGEEDFTKALSAAATLRDNDGKLLWQNQDSADRRLLALQSSWAKWRPEIEEMKPLVDATLKFMSSKTGANGKETPAPGWSGSYEEMVKAFNLDAAVTSDSDIVKQLLEFPGEKRAMFYRMLAGHASTSETNEAGREKGAKEKTQKTIARSFNRTGRWIFNALGGDNQIEVAAQLERSRDILGIMEGSSISKSDTLFQIQAKTLLNQDEAEKLGVELGVTRGARAKPKTGWRPLTDEEKQILSEKVGRTNAEREIVDTLREIEEGNVDPIKYEGWGQQIWYGGLEQSGYIAQAFAGPMALPLLYASTVGMRSEEYRARGVAADQAAGLAMVSAVPETAIELLERRLLLGNVPGLGRVLQNFRATTVSRLATRAGATLAAESAWQTGQELLQDSIPLLWQDLMADETIGIPKVDRDDPRNHVWTWSNAGEVTLTMLMYSLVGMGAASFRDVRDLRDSRKLQALGFTNEAVNAIIGQETAELSEAAMRTLWNDPEMRNPLSKDAKAARAEMSEESAEAAEKIATGAQVSRSADGKFTVTAPDGSVIGKVDTVEAAVGLKETHDAASKGGGHVPPASATQHFEEKLSKTPESDLDAEYDALPESHGGTVFGADHAKEMSEDYRQDRRGLNVAVHGPAGRYATNRFRRELRKVKESGAGADTLVIFTAGGQGSGKSVVNGIRVDDAKKLGFKVLVFDSTLNNADFAHDLIGEAAASGAHVVVSYVHNPVENAMRRNMMRSQDKGGNNRYEPASQVGRIHYRAQKTFLSLAKNPDLAKAGVQFEAWDNSGEPGQHTAIENPVAFLEGPGTLYADEEGSIARAKTAESEAQNGKGLDSGQRPSNEDNTRGPDSGSGSDAGSGNQVAPSLWQNFKNFFSRRAVDDGQPLNEFDKALPDLPGMALDPVSGKIVDSQSVMKDGKGPLGRLYSRFRGGTTSIVERMISHGMVDTFGKKVGPALIEAVDGLDKAGVAQFKEFLHAKRALALCGDEKQPGRNPGMSKEKATEIVQKYGSKDFERRAKIVYDWNKGLLDYVSRFSTSFEKVVMKINEVDPGNYIPLWRVMDSDSPVVNTGEVAPDDTKYAPSRKVTDRLVGSGRAIKDPFESMIKQAEALVGRAHRRKIWETARNLAILHPEMEKFIRLVDESEVPARQKKDTKEDGDARTQLEQAFDEVDAKDGGQHVYARDGAYWFEIDKGLYEVISGVDDAAGSFGDTVVAKALLDGAGSTRAGQWTANATVAGIEQLLKVLRYQARLFRISATAARASFSLGTNVFRDFNTATNNTRTGRFPVRLWANWIGAQFNGAVMATPYLNRIPGFRESVFNQMRELLENAGIGMTGSLSYDAQPLEVSIARINKGNKVAWKKLPEKTLEAVSNLFQFPEMAARVAEAVTIAEQRKLDIQNLSHEEFTDLMIAAKEVTTDFTRGSDLARSINRYVPFFNASIQGKKATYDAFKRDPVGWLFTRGLASSLKAAMAWWLLKDEDWWKEESEQNKLMYDFVMLPSRKDGVRDVIKLPRAHDVDMLFAAGTQAILDSWYQQDPQSLKEWFGGMVEEFSVVGSLDTGINIDALPPVVRETLSQAANRDFFWKRPIVSQTQVKATEDGEMKVEEQYGPYTTKAAIAAGKALGMSPRRIDHFFAGMIPGAGMDAIAMFGRGGPDRDGMTREWEPSDIPVWGRSFTRSGGNISGGQRSVTALFDAFGKVSKSLDRDDDEYTKRDLYRLLDAIRAVQGLTKLERDTPERAARKEIADQRQAIARDAVEELEGK